MMSRPFYFLFFALLLAALAFSCGGKAPAEQSEVTTSSTPAAAPAATTGTPLYPSLPVERMQALYDSVDYIDFVFYYTNFSMNQSEDKSVKATLSQVATEVPNIDPSCQPIGSLFFQSHGKEMIQAELYFTGNCVYYIFLVNGKRTYANKMTPNGLKFYQQIFQQGATTN